MNQTDSDVAQKIEKAYNLAVVVMVVAVISLVAIIVSLLIYTTGKDDSEESLSTPSKLAAVEDVPSSVLVEAVPTTLPTSTTEPAEDRVEPSVPAERLEEFAIEANLPHGGTVAEETETEINGLCSEAAGYETGEEFISFFVNRLETKNGELLSEPGYDDPKEVVIVTLQGTLKAYCPEEAERLGMVS